MTNRINKCRRLMTTTAIGLAGLAVPMTSAHAQLQLEEVIVTARKTEENLQEIPLSVTAHTGASLKNAGVTEFTEIAQLTPNFDIRSDDVRGEFSAELTIRGQTTTTSDLTIDQAVGINVNGVPITRGTNLFGNLFDIEQVEIVRGPQGTLFGKNTTGGLVSVTTRAPQLGVFEGYVEGTVGNFDRTDLEAVVNIPLGETTALRLGAATTQRDGFGEGVGSDGTPTGVDLANDDEEFFRASFLYQPNDSFSLRINADTHEVDENGAIVRALISAFPIATAITPANFFQGNDFSDGIVLPNSPEPSVTAEEDNINATIEVDFGAVTLTSVTGYREQDSETDLNFSPLGAIIIGQDSELLTQELRIAGGNDAINWQAGVFLSSEEGNDRNNTVGRAQVTFVENESFSVFAQGNFNLTDQLALTAGLRFTQDDRSVDLQELGVLGGSVDAAVATFGTTALGDGIVVLNDPAITTIQNEADFDEASWTVALDYQVTDSTLLYGSISRGFRSGGIDGDGDLSTEVQPELVDNIEVGIKTDVLGDKLRFNAALWFSDYTDIQIQSFALDATVAGTTGVPVAVLANAAEATLGGFEAELQWFPSSNFTLNAGVGFTDGDFDEFLEPALAVPGDPSTLFFNDRSDEPIGGPELQFSLTGRYEFAVGGNTRGAVQLTYSYLDEQILADADVVALVEQSGPGFGTVDAIDLVNGQVDFTIGEKLNVALFGKNLTDEEYFSTGFALEVFGGLAQRNIGAPRTYGVRVRYDF